MANISKYGKVVFRLKTMKYLLDVHCHTTASGHAYSTIAECAKEASKKGLELLAITDHAPEMPGGASVVHFINLKSLPKKICGVEILRGVELNILDKSGRVDLKASLMRSLDICIASLHVICLPSMSKENNTLAIINAMKNPYIDIIGHPGDPRYPIDIDTVVSKAKETGTMIEINNQSLNPESSRAGGNDIILEIAEKCKKMGTMVVVGSDSHFCTDVGEFGNASKLLESIQMPEELIANSSTALLKSLLKKRSKNHKKL